MMRAVGHENVYYCDTDSIFTSQKLDDKFISDDILGKWKLEYIVDEAFFLAPKAYSLSINKTFIDEIKKNNNSQFINKTKGCNLKSGKKEDGSKVNKNDLIKLQKGDIKELVVKDVMFKRSFENVKIIDEQVRTIKPVYNKRHWIKNNSLPFDKI